MLPLVIVITVFGLLMRLVTGSWGWFKVLGVYVSLYLLALTFGLLTDDGRHVGGFSALSTP